MSLHWWMVWAWFGHTGSFITESLWLLVITCVKSSVVGANTVNTDYRRLWIEMIWLDLDPYSKQAIQYFENCDTLKGFLKDKKTLKWARSTHLLHRDFEQDKFTTPTILRSIIFACIVFAGYWHDTGYCVNIDITVWWHQVQWSVQRHHG